VPASEAGGAGRKKSATKILAALVCSQARLTHGHSHSLEQVGLEVQLPVGMSAAHLVDGCAGQKLGMVKATPALLCCVHGHSDNEHLPRSCLGPGKHFQAVSQEHAQPAGDWLHPLVLEQVNQRP